MFEINGSHIASLTDADLRTLVARLCEADLRRAGLPISAVTAGGHQDAADGGLDVRVTLPPSTLIDGFIARPATGFQVKVPKMAPAAIKTEMCPGGILRSVLHGLAAESGAYIIVSAKDSVTDAGLGNRRDAMREAASGAPDAQNLFLDFYDQERLASWVRVHPGMVAWVRERIGQSIRGWRPYESWANPSESTEAEYLLDERERILDWQAPQDGNLTAPEGIRRIREALARPKGVVRLVGLSGTGKTRLIQALFDERVGEQALDPTLAVYTDLGDEPEPRPLELMRQFTRNGQRAVLVVDNCSAETHHALAEACAAPESSLSLITVEFDIREDDPEGTDIYQLEPSSKSLIESLLAHRASHISQVNRERIAEFSEGNSRIALALAHTLRRGESVGRLTNLELFNRLFLQRHPDDDGLLSAAETCSLVYSFEGELLAGDGAELPLLADLAGLSVGQLFRHTAVLRDRGLIQARGSWRAVLPQAIAIRLAHQALDRIPQELILSCLVERAPERLARSFSRRLGQLHDSDVARRIVHGWLFADGPLSNLTALSPLQVDMVRNIAPVDPEAALAAIERAVNGENGVVFVSQRNFHRHTWVLLLKSIAYEKGLFQRATILLLRFVLAEGAFGYESARNMFLNLFQIRLSGTMASIEQRLTLVAALVSNKDTTVRDCGLDALNNLMKTAFFTMPHASDFGARPRSYGLYPRTTSDLIKWYGTTIEFAKGLALAPEPINRRARQIVGDRFNELWRVPGLFDYLEVVARSLTAQRFWPEGWVAIRGAIRAHAEEMAPDLLDRLRVLEQELAPKDLVERALAYTLATDGSWRDIADAEPEGDEPADAVSAYHRANQITEELGREVAQDSQALAVLAPELVRGSINRGWYFGRGLAKSTNSLPATWSSLVDAYTATPQQMRNDLVLRGFISVAAERDRREVAAFLDAAIGNPALGPIFPALQAAFPIDDSDAKRLFDAIRREIAPIYGYRFLGRGPALEMISLDSLQELIRELASQPDGFSVAAEVFFRFLDGRQDKGQPDNGDLARAGRELLSCITFGSADSLLDYRLTGIVTACMTGEESLACAASVCRLLHAALRDHRVSTHHYRDFTVSLFQVQPGVALDEFFGDQVPVTGANPSAGFEYCSKSPVEMVPIDALLAWAQISPIARFPRLAAAIDPFSKSESEVDPVLIPAAVQLLAHAPDRTAVLDQFGFSEWPKGVYSRPLSAIFEGRRELARTFLSDGDPEVRAWAQAIDVDLVHLIEHERQRELPGSGSFE